MPTPLITDLLAATQSAVAAIKAEFYQKNSSQIQEKADFQDIVTATDQLVQKLLVANIELLAKKFNLVDLGFIGEETDDKLQPAKHTFIIDPIDGTTNFANRLPNCVISIGYAVDGNFVAGLIVQPLTGEYWWAEKGQGAWYVFPDKQIVQALKILPQKLSNSLVSTHLNGQLHAAWQFELYQKLYRQVRGLRSSGSLTLDLAQTAQNIYQLGLNGQTFIWDVAAAWVLLEEAGGVILGPNGQKINFDWHQPKAPFKIIFGQEELIQTALMAINAET